MKGRGGIFVAKKRILFLGITGVDKRNSLERFAAHCTENYARECRVIDFESEFLYSGGGPSHRSSFLDGDIQTQRSQWGQGWDRLEQEVSEDSGDVILGVHGCYIRGHYGCRWIFDPLKVASFKPDLIVTMIADVYDMWWRTEHRAGGEAWKGRPTLEQLVLGRRFEVAAGDQIALCARCRHLVVAVGHPVDTLARCLYRSSPCVAYLSFPISEPRRMARNEDQSGIEDVSEFIKYSHSRQKMSANLACICPLAIDELPFVKSLVSAPGDEAQFDRDGQRWDLGQFWPQAERFGVPPSPNRAFPTEQIRNACGSITTDVGWRDYRLVEQADCLAVFNPVFNNSGKVSRGVLNEIVFAQRHGKPCYVYQSERHDPSGKFKEWLGAQGTGTMGGNPSTNLITLTDSLEAMFDAIC